MRRLALLALVLLVTVEESSGRSLRLVGRTDLGGAGLNGDVAVVGRTAIVAAGITPGAGAHTFFYNPVPCGTVDVKIVSLEDPAHPLVVGKIPVPKGSAALDVDARHVRTEKFTGDLAAIALARCASEGDFVDRGIAYYDVTTPALPRFLGRYMADAEMAKADAPPCGPGAGDRCASSQHSVALVVRDDGRILSLSTEPGASGSSFPSGDLRVVDVRDPAHPRQITSYPAGEKSVWSRNGCRPFTAGYTVSASADGKTAFLASFDGGVMALDLTDPEHLWELGQVSYPSERSLEGNTAYVSTTRTGGRLLALVSEEDWIAPLTTLRITEPARMAGSHFGCEAMFTLFDRDQNAPIFRKPGS